MPPVAFGSQVAYDVYADRRLALISLKSDIGRMSFRLGLHETNVTYVNFTKIKESLLSAL